MLRFSNQLQVTAYDLATHKELRHVVIPVPRVHGERAAEGFHLSPDGQALIYAELHEPNLLLVLSTKNLGEVRRTTVLPFTAEDSYRVFGGVNEHGILSFSCARSGKLRFVDINLSDFKVASEVIGPAQLNAEPTVWSARSRTVWVQLPSGAWQEYHEDGTPTEAKLDFHFLHGADNGAKVLGPGKLLAFYGSFSDQGAVAVYSDGRTGQLELKCVPRGFSSGDVPGYVGAICTTRPDREPEHGGDKVLSSEFLLLKADGPTVAWRHSMEAMTVRDSDDVDSGFQKGEPLLYLVGPKLLIVSVSKSPALTVYELDIPQ